ncbi:MULTISPECIES: hypothetical protein [Streptosporangium]|uniref:Type II secretion system protein n=1 Tax=Streptosporangium brasiliense TaxID=47480 RepID=A0ABT9R4I2_9ACTN|nr:hypothetical protein [Streptosporangium brasiliense]MDP9864129.1 hypothetical protein [Streptosporangium brasiliense]
MSVTLLLETLLGVLLTVSAAVTVAVLWPGPPRRRPPVPVQQPPPCRPLMTAAGRRGTAQRGRRHRG